MSRYTVLISCIYLVLSYHGRHPVPVHTPQLREEKKCCVTCSPPRLPSPSAAMGDKAMSFLNNKSFHPGNAANRAKIFEAEVKKKQEDTKKEELRKEYEQMQSRRETKALLYGEDKVDAAGMSFMYAKPPGYVEAQNKQRKKDDAEKTKADRDKERFAILENAPRQGEYTNNLDVVHKPFGVELRQVKCKRCGAWGHEAGDRECPLRNAPNPRDDEQKARDDPLARAAGAESSGVPLRWTAKMAPEDGVHGGASATDANQ